MTLVFVSLGTFAIALAGFLIVLGLRSHAPPIFGVGLVLVGVAAAVAQVQPTNGPLAFTAAVAWVAAAGIALRLLGVRWAMWMTFPAVICLVAWPALRHTVPLLSLLAALALIFLAPVLVTIFAIRAGQGVLKGLFGDDAAAHVVGHWLINLFGGFGRSRRRSAPDPVLPRPGVHEFHPRDVGARHDPL